MTFISTEYTTLTTPLGTLLVWANGLGTTEDGHTVDVVGYRTEHEHNLRYRMGNLTREQMDSIDATVRINRVDWHVHGVVDLDPETGERVENKAYCRTSDIVRRTDLQTAHWESRQKAEAKLLPIVREAITTWAKTDDGKAFLKRARFAAANNALDDVTRDIGKLDADRDELVARQNALLATLKANR